MLVSAVMTPMSAFYVQVKASMKATSPKARVLQRILNARQFGLKMIANVSYGYTAAGFSGRMPMAELADSIVQVELFATARGDLAPSSSPTCNVASCRRVAGVQLLVLGTVHGITGGLCTFVAHLLAWQPAPAQPCHEQPAQP